jgi:hypothetical protein
LDSTSGLAVGNFYEKSVSGFTPSERRWAVKLFIRTHNETLSVAAMRVKNPDYLAFAIHGRDPSQTPSRLLEIVSDDFPVLRTGILWFYSGCGNDKMTFDRQQRDWHARVTRRL